MQPKVTEHYLEYESHKYFRKNAHNTRMGSYGEKKGLNGSLDVQANVKSEHLAGRVKFNTVVAIDWSQTSKADVEAGGFLKFFGLGAKAAAETTYEKVKSGKLKLMNFAIHEGPLTAMLNQDADGARKYLADEGKNGRIVSEVWVLVDAEIAEHFSASKSISVSADAGAKGLAITAKGATSGTQTITDQ